MNQNEIPKLERLRATLTDLIAFAERKTVEADDQDRDILQLEHDGDLPAPIMDARVQLALLGRMVEEGPERAFCGGQQVTEYKTGTLDWGGVDHD